MITRLLIASHFLVLIVGCSSGGDDSPQVVIPMDTSVIRTYQEGDSVTMDMTLRQTSTGQTITGKVTMTVGTIVPNPFGVDCKSIAFTGTLTGPSGSVSILDKGLFYQDVSGSLYECGDYDDNLGKYVFLTDTTTTPNGIFLEKISPMQIGDTTSGIVFYDDGSWEDCTETVVAIENISVPIGLYEAYKIQESCTESDGTTSSGTDWFVPSIFTIKETETFDGITGEAVITDFSFN